MRFLIIYCLILVCDLLARQLQTEMPYLEYFFKPSLMISLGIYFYHQSGALKQKKIDYFILSALVFSGMGDILLMFEGKFILGLASFLLAHLSYILAFLADNKGWVFSKSDRLWAALLIVVLGIGFIFYLSPYLGSLKTPVFLYSSAILTMLLATLNRWKSVRIESFHWVFVGAVLFVISDSLLAVNKFAHPFYLANFLIMLTYGVGQYLIVEGYLKKEGN
jgi:uncharacterized membrane protein YhhN